jgi:hypothetical protein
MTTYSTISNAAVAVGAIPSSTTVTALRDNPIAIAEAAAGAPVIFAGWHPVTKVTVGDGVIGKYYDFSVDGAVASITSPDFEDGYEYRIIIDGASHGSGASRAFSVGLYEETDAAYETVYTSATIASSQTVFLDMEILMPRLSKATHIVRVNGRVSGVTINDTWLTSGTNKILNVKFNWDGGITFDAGKVYLFRRREFASLD